ncbi:hypothetical protein [Nostoc sp.]|uniref:hypothetical protein n=1 Tax=Nostoc sp. TaxID=1180 RepID=UPI002FFC4040
MINEENTSPDEYFKQKALKEELNLRCESVVTHYGITECGLAYDDSPKPYKIQRNGEYLYFTLEEAIEYLEKLSKQNP